MGDVMWDVPDLTFSVGSRLYESRGDQQSTIQVHSGLLARWQLYVHYISVFEVIGKTIFTA